MNAGDFIDGYQLTAQAPVEYIRCSRTREINGRLVVGSWSDPWWAYCPKRGWALVRRWKNKEYPATQWSESVPATDTLVIESWGYGQSGSEEVA